MRTTFTYFQALCLLFILIPKVSAQIDHTPRLYLGNNIFWNPAYTGIDGNAVNLSNTGYYDLNWNVEPQLYWGPNTSIISFDKEI